MFLKIILMWLVLVPVFMKAEKEEKIENNSDDTENPEKLLASRSIHHSRLKRGISYTDLSLEMAKLHLLEHKLQNKKGLLDDLRSEVNEKSPDKCTRITKVGDPIVHHHSGQKYGAWMRDPLGILGPQTIWYMNNYYGNELLKFDSMDEFKAGMISKTYHLPYNYDGTGAVVYGRYLYYNRADTKYIVQYDLVTESVKRQKYPKSSIVPRKYQYQWNGYSTFDLSIDESGLWVMYANPSSGKLCVSLLDPLTLDTLQKEQCDISSETMTSMGNAFVSCGIVYMIDSYDTKTTTINYAYDTTTGQGWIPQNTQSKNIQFKNQFGATTMVTYNPRDKVLYAWDNHRQITYPLVF